MAKKKIFFNFATKTTAEKRSEERNSKIIGFN